MNSEINAVRTFQEKMKVSAMQRLTECPSYESAPTATNSLHNAAGWCRKLSRGFEAMLPDFPHDRRILRAHLMLEELGELIEAMGLRNEDMALDALADLTYVVNGTAVTFDLPLHEAFWEVHKSNMTKQKMPTDPSKDRIRDKGQSYVAPDLEAILRRYRCWR